MTTARMIPTRDEDSWETEESDELDADGGGDEESEDKTV